MLRKVGLYYRTLRHLRREQVQYRLYYLLRRRWRRFRPVSYPAWNGQSAPIQLADSIASYESWDCEGGFRFLNLAHDFGTPAQIDWEFAEFGKLWTYNLCYFEFLVQPQVSQAQGLAIIRAFIRQYPQLKTAAEPYPTSLRIIFWIRFLRQHQIQDAEIDRALYVQAQTLADHLEYHLLGNHLLENGFGLWFAAVYFQDLPLLRKAEAILKPELTEQIMADGAHFERSPMYHSIMLYRVLDCLNLARHNMAIFQPCANWENRFAEKAALMLGWLMNMTFPDGRYPHWADAAPEIAPVPQALFDYARRLGVEPRIMPLGESGYRRMDWDAFSLMVDVGDIGPDYIPGHAHADTFSFVLNVDQQPYIVDTGISTYEKNARRQSERATSAHNTVQIGAHEQSEVWGGFRVGRRAYVRILEEQPDSSTKGFRLRAEHNGYAHLGGRHARCFAREGDDLVIEDVVTAPAGEFVYAYLHFAAGVEVQIAGQTLVSPSAIIHLEGATHLQIVPYALANGYNQFATHAVKAIITFENRLLTRITTTK